MRNDDRDLFEIERNLIKKGFAAVAGVDEAGRGPLAGPVFAAAVILNPDDIPKGIDDSKKLSEKKREALFDEIKAKAAAFAICIVWFSRLSRTPPHLPSMTGRMPIFGSEPRRRSTGFVMGMDFGFAFMSVYLLENSVKDTFII